MKTSVSILRAALACGSAILASCSGSDGDTSGAAAGSSAEPGLGGTAPGAGGVAAGKGGSGGAGSSGKGGTAEGGVSASGAGGRSPGNGGAGAPSSGGSLGNGEGGAPSGGAASAGKGGSSNGGSGVAGKSSTAGTGAGGSTTGGAPMGGSSSGGAASSYPCDGTTSGYDAIMTKTGSTWTVVNGERQVHSGSDMEAALRAAYASLTAGRTQKESILVQGSGDIPASSQVGIPSYTILNVCGTINVTGTSSGDKSPLYARNATDIEIPNVKMTGGPVYGIFLRGTKNIHLGRVELRLTRSAGIGIRVDTSGNAGTDTQFVRGLRADYVYGSGMSSHVLETYGIDDIEIGTVEGEDVGECALLLNRSINASIGLVSCTNCGAVDSGYAAFRMANKNGAIGGSDWDQVNIVVKRVVARGGPGRGLFCVSQSGAARIDHVDIEDVANNSILLENCYNVTVGNPDEQSRITDSGQLRLAARTEFSVTRDITMQNIAVSGTPIQESPCATNSTWTAVNGAPTNCN